MESSNSHLDRFGMASMKPAATSLANQSPRGGGAAAGMVRDLPSAVAPYALGEAEQPPAEAAAALPELVVFDLDMCTWSPEMYTLTKPPTRAIQGDLGRERLHAPPLPSLRLRPWEPYVTRTATRHCWGCYSHRYTPRLGRALCVAQTLTPAPTRPGAVSETVMPPAGKAVGPAVADRAMAGVVGAGNGTDTVRLFPGALAALQEVANGKYPGMRIAAASRCAFAPSLSRRSVATTRRR